MCIVSGHQLLLLKGSWGLHGDSKETTHCLPFAKGAKAGMGNGGIAAPAPPLPAVEASC